MGKIGWKQRLKDSWFSLTIKRKIYFFTGTVFFIIFISIMFNIWVVNFTVNDFRAILEDNARNSECMDAMQMEARCFEEYIKKPSEENEKELELSCSKTSLAISRLPYDYASIGALRYAKTWSIRNSYETYEKERDFLLIMGEEHPNYIRQLYKIYNMQAYIQKYVGTLMTYTLQEGTAAYTRKIPYLKGVPFAILISGIFLSAVIINLAQLMNKTLILPIMSLVSASKKIAESDFSVKDVKVYNQDEMGELVKAFNKMKEETGQYIEALKEKREIASLLHKEELEKLEIARRLEAAKLEVLKNQIKPHFLFNTLNVIAGMSYLEEAKITEKMIKALSALFRYNLKTTENEVTLAQELKIVEDYMYLQQMRFGSRIDYHIDCKLNQEAVKVPAFSFQPLIENALIHGICKKEQGGKVYVRIWEKENTVIISIADTGVGMAKDQLENLRKELKQGTTEKIGIGLGNIYKRLHTMYPDCEVDVFSKKDIGTAVRMKIPHKEWEE